MCITFGLGVAYHIVRTQLNTETSEGGIQLREHVRGETTAPKIWGLSPFLLILQVLRTCPDISRENTLKTIQHGALRGL